LAFKTNIKDKDALDHLNQGSRRGVQEEFIPRKTLSWRLIASISALHRWLDRACASGIELIRNFAYQLRQDILAVEAAVTEKWSNGTGRRSSQSAEDDQAPDVWPGRG
jgi:hypothetical protein